MSRNTRPRDKKPKGKKPAGVRIIAGQWRGRRLPVADVEGLRPTGDRLRETLFNWLQPVIDGAHCLDLFAGTGALGFEALSRGAARAVLIEHNRSAMQGLQQARDLLEADMAELHFGDAAELCRHPPLFAAAPFDLVFVDPPWSFFDHRAVLRNLSDNQWLKPGAQIYAEMPIDKEFLPPVQLHEINRKIIGQAQALLFRYKKTQNS